MHDQADDGGFDVTIESASGRRAEVEVDEAVE